MEVLRLNMKANYFTASGFQNAVQISVGWLSETHTEPPWLSDSSLGFITTLLRKSRNWIWYITVALNRFEKNLITTHKTIGSLPRPTSSLRFKKTRTSGFLILKYFKNWNHRLVTKSNTHPTMEQTWRPKLRNFGTYVHNSFLRHY